MTAYISFSFTGPDAQYSLLGDRAHRGPLLPIESDAKAAEDTTRAGVTVIRMRRCYCGQSFRVPRKHPNVVRCLAHRKPRFR